ncbi:hypothetical protein [Mycetocola saprophilus]|uniref:hypothetical protein n=1 Tax=Mycetocola saprophilus TaxID=76636 RepID=UPI003BF42DAC
MKNKHKVTVGLITGLLAAAVVAGPASANIVLYQHINYGGTAWDFGTGYKQSLGDADKRASSLKVSKPANSTILYSGLSYGGTASQEFFIGAPDLRQWNFNDRARSLK